MSDTTEDSKTMKTTTMASESVVCETLPNNDSNEGYNNIPATPMNISSEVVIEPSKEMIVQKNDVEVSSEENEGEKPQATSNQTIYCVEDSNGALGVSTNKIDVSLPSTSNAKENIASNSSVRNKTQDLASCVHLLKDFEELGSMEQIQMQIRSKGKLPKMKKKRAAGGGRTKVKSSNSTPIFKVSIQSKIKPSSTVLSLQTTTSVSAPNSKTKQLKKQSAA